LLALAADTGEHPRLQVQAATTGREFHTAGDMAAALDWRLPEPATINTKIDTTDSAHPRSTRGRGRRALAINRTSSCGHMNELTARC